MTLAEIIKDDLKADEGFVPHAYEDHLGYLTIGYGILIDKRKGGGITEEEGAYLLENRITGRMRELSSRVDGWSTFPPQVQRALTNMSYQMGVDGLLRFKNTLALIRKGKYAEAAEEALNSNWARQTPERAKRVAGWIRSA